MIKFKTVAKVAIATILALLPALVLSESKNEIVINNQTEHNLLDRMYE